MPNEKVQVLRAEDYFETYGRNGIGKGLDRTLARRQLIDAFRRAIFGLVAIRAKKHFNEIPAEGDPEALRIARNIIKDETRKWVKVCRLFDQYRETCDLIHPSDLSEELDMEIMGKNESKEEETNGYSEE